MKRLFLHEMKAHHRFISSTRALSERLVIAGYWSTYWYDGKIYGQFQEHWRFSLIPITSLTTRRCMEAQCNGQDDANPITR